MLEAQSVEVSEARITDLLRQAEVLLIEMKKVRGEGVSEAQVDAFAAKLDDFKRRIAYNLEFEAELVKALNAAEALLPEDVADAEPSHAASPGTG
jgi:hypothetical protein